jgi:hypothetical protein
MPGPTRPNNFVLPPRAAAVRDASGDNKARPRKVMGVALLAASFAAWVAYATPAQRWPGLAALMPAENALKFGPVSARRGEVNGQTVLYVEGSLLNSGKRARKTPALRLTLVGEDGQPIYSWRAKATSPQMQATAAFQTRLLAPPETFRNIAISFDEG